jgi:hypothetical protein
MDKITKITVAGLTVGILSAFALFNTSFVNIVKAIAAPPSVRLTSMCKINEEEGLMRFREENGVSGFINWNAKYPGSTGYFAQGQVGGGSTIFFNAPAGQTIIVDWNDQTNEISGSTTKAQNTKACIVVTICYEGKTQEWIQDKGSIPEGATEGECVIEPTQPPNQGGPGDGLSDGRSDGGSSCPDCTKAPAGQVLGASTDFARTGGAVDMLVNAIGAVGGLSTAVGLALIGKKKS